MNLSFDTIKGITFGWVDCYQEDGLMYFYKCTKNQIAAWEPVEDGMVDRAKATTGIVLDFETNSEVIDFEMVGKKFEVLINGTYFDCFFAADDKNCFSLALDGGENRVQIFFPFHSRGVVKSITIDDGASIKPHKYDEKILFLGDSITQGWSSTFDYMAYTSRVSAMMNAEAVVHAVGGGYYRPCTFEKVDFEPDRVVVAYGTNDYSEFDDVESFENAVREYLCKVEESYSDKKKYVILPTHRYDNRKVGIGSFENLREALRHVAGTFDVTIVDGYVLIPDDFVFFYDELHPNALGFDRFANGLVSTFRGE